MSYRILAIGKNSMLARWWQASVADRLPVSFAHHGDIGNDGALDGVACVVSFCRHPDYDRAPVDADEDPNARIAAWLAPGRCRMVMLSSSKVYAPQAHAVRETDALTTQTTAALNRVNAERLASERLGERLSILRCANIVGYEPDEGRSTFMGMVLRGLRDNGTVEFNCRPDIRRDFLPDVCFIECLERVVRAPGPGIFNVGSGIALEMSEVAGWVIEGYGAGRIVQTGDKHLPDMAFDMTRFSAVYGAPPGIDAIRRRCIAIGRQLRQNSAPEAPVLVN